MKKIEELLNIDLGRKLDTPKKLNRSANEIPAQIINDLESGIFTAEMIAKLGKQFPIFHYRTCITIHGKWPEVERQRIGQFKNVHQNKNGSVEIFYSAIDRQKIKQICNMKAGLKCNFQYMENSTDRVFRWSQTITKANFEAVRAQMEPVAKKLTEQPIYGFINLYVAQGLWSQYLTLDLHPLAILEENVKPFTLALLDMTEDQYQAARAEADREAITEAERVKEANRIWEEKQKAIKAEAEKNLNRLLPQIQHLDECNDITKGILVKIMPNKYEAGHHFTYLKKEGAGAFGRLKISKAESPDFRTDNLTWSKAKQQRPDELKLKGWRLAQANKAQQKPRIEPKPTPAKQATGLKVLTTINY